MSLRQSVRDWLIQQHIPSERHSLPLLLLCLGPLQFPERAAKLRQPLEAFPRGPGTCAVLVGGVATPAQKPAAMEATLVRTGSGGLLAAFAALTVFRA